MNKFEKYFKNEYVEVNNGDIECTPESILSFLDDCIHSNIDTGADFSKDLKLICEWFRETKKTDVN